MWGTKLVIYCILNPQWLGLFIEPLNHWNSHKKAVVYRARALSYCSLTDERLSARASKHFNDSLALQEKRTPEKHSFKTWQIEVLGGCKKGNCCYYVLQICVYSFVALAGQNQCRHQIMKRLVKCKTKHFCEVTSLFIAQSANIGHSQYHYITALRTAMYWRKYGPPLFSASNLELWHETAPWLS